MEEILDFLVGILMFILRTIVFAFYSIFLLVGGIFSPSIRRQLKDRWNRSTWEQASMITGMLLGLAFAVIALVYVLPAFSNDEDALKSGPPEQEEIAREESGEADKLRDQAIGKGLDFLKNKLRKEE